VAKNPARWPNYSRIEAGHVPPSKGTTSTTRSTSNGIAMSRQISYAILTTTEVLVLKDFSTNLAHVLLVQRWLIDQQTVGGGLFLVSIFGVMKTSRGRIG
jgi:hypothetical protein